MARGRAVEVLAVLSLAARGQGAATDCVSYLNMPNGDLPGMPTVASSSATCREMCVAHAGCAVYSFIGPQSVHSNRCNPKSPGDGCCWLKTVEVSGSAPTVWDPYACSGYVRPPKPNGTATNSRPHQNNMKRKVGDRNVLYMLVDDLRPDLLAYGQNFTHNPNIAKLASSAMVFDNAYCQISVCSPSRMSFMMGRRPDHPGVYNFINHIRQADCGISEAETSYTGVSLLEINTGTFNGGCQWGGSKGACGGSGQCCSLCTEHRECAYWTYTGNLCSLKYANATKTTAPGSVSGRPGTTATQATWTSNPQLFKNAGFLTLHTGKLFHTEEGGVANSDPDLNGPGMPPNSDPQSWSFGLAMGQVNAVANMFGVGPGEEFGVDATLDGIMADTSATTHQLADRVIAQDAVAKLRLASLNKAATGQPFYMAVGFRKPHLPFRFPAPFLQFLPALNKTAVALHPTLDKSVPEIAHADKPPQSPPQFGPYTPVPNSTAKEWRQHYYASIAWMDHQLGVVLNELDALGHTDDTLVVLHSDHGWSLGEHAEWQKFSNFEHGVRVPLIVRAPWISQSRGTRSRTLAELIDVLPTMASLMGIALPANEVFDGKDLSLVLSDPGNVKLADELKPYAMSQYPRCPSNESTLWKDNDCLFTDRVEFPFMGYTIRTRTHRYTEWTKWNGSALLPDHTQEGFVGHELYSHRDVGLDYSFDEFENVNEADNNPEIVEQMRALLHAVIDEQTRLRSFSPGSR